MRAAISLLVLLLSMCGVQTESHGTDFSPQDVSTELKELRDMVVDLRVTLRHTRDDFKVLEAENVAVKGRLVASETKVQILDKALQDTKAEMKTEVDNLKKENAAQETELAVLKTRLAATETEVKDLKKMDSAALEAELTAVKTRLAASETEVMNLKKENAAQEAELTVLKSSLAATESAIQDLNTTNKITETEVKALKESAAHEQELTAVKTRLADSETMVDNLKRENAAQETELAVLKKDSAAHKQELASVKTRLDATKTEVENLEKEIRVAPKVAFSAALRESGSGYTEAGSSALKLVFKKVFTNVGEAYSSTTGFFTAPVRGVYYFRFTVMDYLASHHMYILMHKNGEKLMRLREYDTDGHWNYLSGGLTVLLEKGDTVNMGIPAGYRLYDDADNESNFSGFLLFPL